MKGIGQSEERCKLWDQLDESLADVDLQPMLQWVESGQKPQWNAVAGCSPTTKGLFLKFDSLHVSEGVLQRAWEEPATGKER